MIAAVGVPLYLSGGLHRLDPLALNVVSAALVVVPVAVGLSVAESILGGATPGKRLFRLAVRDAATGGIVRFPKALLRNCLKVGLPWAIGHAAVIGIVAGAPGDPSPAVDALLVLAYALPIAYVVSLFPGSGLTPYDRAAATTVALVVARTEENPARTVDQAGSR